MSGQQANEQRKLYDQVQQYFSQSQQPSLTSSGMLDPYIQLDPAETFTESLQLLQIVEDMRAVSEFIKEMRLWALAVVVALYLLLLLVFVALIRSMILYGTETAAAADAAAHGGAKHRGTPTREKRRSAGNTGPTTRKLQPTKQCIYSGGDARPSTLAPPGSSSSTKYGTHKLAALAEPANTVSSVITPTLFSDSKNNSTTNSDSSAVSYAGRGHHDKRVARGDSLGYSSLHDRRPTPYSVVHYESNDPLFFLDSDDTRSSTARASVSPPNHAELTIV